MGWNMALALKYAMPMAIAFMFWGNAPAAPKHMLGALGMNGGVGAAAAAAAAVGAGAGGGGAAAAGGSVFIIISPRSWRRSSQARRRGGARAVWARERGWLCCVRVVCFTSERARSRFLFSRIVVTGFSNEARGSVVLAPV